ncbi:ABC transporter permease [Variovorax sp. OV329]|uniref:ABC transporter permease n=1 Tax=Variovorax sp. OV329 TaxID=1882825 RepID=UPI0008E72081|nr:ABC transporter permease [Variovorax sp. OV329]SFM32857.1 monosaccharide ABC transporter membrane protein, CUT2 family [Variovorax sp. OV329]
MAHDAPSIAADPRKRIVGPVLRSQGALIALLLVLVFGALRYDHFLGAENAGFLLGSTAKFGLLAIGMAFVILSGGIDLSVGTVAVLASVVAAQLSPHGIAPAIAGAVAVGLAFGLVNGFVIARFRLMPFVVTLCTFMAARGLALVVSGRETVSISYEAGYDQLAESAWLGLTLPTWIMLAAFALGALMLRYSRFGRAVLAVGGNEEAARLMGVPAARVKMAVYALSGALAGLAGAILAAQTSGSPTEGTGWELVAIAAVVVGGTRLSGGQGSVLNTLTGVLLLAVILNLINFENGYTSGPHLSLGSYWQTVVRGGFLLAVVLLQARLAHRPGGPVRT